MTTTSHTKTAPNPFHKRPIRNKTQEKRHTQRRLIFGALIIGVLGSFQNLIHEDFLELWRASVLDYAPIEFTGTVSPIEKVPNWTELSDAERTMNYDQLKSRSKLIPIPRYNISIIQKGKNYNGGSDMQRNTFITYSVPYMGNYMLDGTQNSGSHPGVDIKTPIGTPVRSIANGIVHKAEFSQYGSGNYVTIAHPGMPDPENPSQTTTLFSSYAHLSSFSVKEGDRVTKGDIIGKTGNSGMTTAPHLHFQIDREDAPFYPYWPFTWNDLQKAGLASFFDGVKNGVGARNAIKYTYNPIDVLHAFENYQDNNLVVSADPDFTPEKPQKPKNQTNKETPAEETKPVEKTEPTKETVQITDSNNTENTQTVQKEVKEEKPNTPIIEQQTTQRDRPIKMRIDENAIVFEDIQTYIPNTPQRIKLLIKEEDLIVSSEPIQVTTTLRGLNDVTPKTLTQKDFRDGIAEIEFHPHSQSDFRFVVQGPFGEIKSNSIRAQIFKDIPPSHQFANAIENLKQQRVIDGYEDGTFRPQGTLNRAEAVKILINGNNVSLAKMEGSRFSDVPTQAWFTDFVNTASERGIIKGYPDGLFHPAKEISRAEFLKVAILTRGISPSTPTSDPYRDVGKDEWFAPYFEFSKTHSLLLIKGDIADPAFPITRGEAAYIIDKLSKLNIL